MDLFDNMSNRLKDYSYLDVSLTQWLILLSITAIAWVILRFILSRAIQKLEVRAHETDTKLDDALLKVLSKMHGIFITILCLFVTAKILGLSKSSTDLFYRMLVVATFFQCALWGNELVTFGLRRYIRRRGGPEQESAEVSLAAYSAVSITAKFLLWVILFLLLLDNLGVNITALITGLGIGGIAIALAVQNILGDIFASLTIILDRPFEVGDFIVVDGNSGTVESIGLKTSRIKSLSGEQLVYPNKKLVETEIQNFKRMHTRRIVFGFGVVYETSVEKLRKIPAIVKEVLDGIPNVTLDRVHFKSFNDSSLDFELVYIMQVPDYAAYMDAQHEFNLSLMSRFIEESIEFAYPTRTVLLRNLDEPAPPPRNDLALLREGVQP